MKKVWIVCAMMTLVLAGGLPLSAMAEDLDGKWVIGSWLATFSAHGGVGRGEADVDLKTGGLMEGGARSSIGSVTFSDGAWKVDGQTLVMTYRVPLGTRPGTYKVTWTLQREAEELVGSYLRDVDNGGGSLRLKRVKK